PQDQTRAEFESEKSDHKQKTPKTGIQKTLRPTNGKIRDTTKKQQTKTTKHTIEFSNNRCRFQATLPLYCM
ncbi:hypothetical protein, partial [Mycobacterium sp. PSTR-4-N]|uniref:hypothetical protein n=1 Tax=Mycobacterium sp. PSTR-4-N TaxID=2917745 RepID=UPI001F1504F6